MQILCVRVLLRCIQLLNFSTLVPVLVVPHLQALSVSIELRVQYLEYKSLII